MLTELKAFNLPPVTVSPTKFETTSTPSSMYDLTRSAVPCGFVIAFEARSEQGML